MGLGGEGVGRPCEQGEQQCGERAGGMEQRVASGRGMLRRERGRSEASTVRSETLAISLPSGSCKSTTRNNDSSRGMGRALTTCSASDGHVASTCCNLADCTVLDRRARRKRGRRSRSRRESPRKRIWSPRFA